MEVHGSDSEFQILPSHLEDFTWKSLGSDLEVFGKPLVMRLRISFNVRYNPDFNSLRLFATFSVLDLFPNELDRFQIHKRWHDQVSLFLAFSIVNMLDIDSCNHVTANSFFVIAKNYGY